MSAPKRAAETHRDFAAERLALARMDEATLALQVELARIASPTFAEEQRGARVAESLRKAGWDVEVDVAGNVVARAGERNRPPLAVCSHLDTVYADQAPPAVERRGSRITGSGVCDNSRGLAALVSIATVLRPRLADLRHPVELVATTGEEGSGDLRGAKQYVADAGPVALIALDGAGDQRIVNSALGSRRFRIAFHGTGGHSWSAFGIANPVHAAARCGGGIAALRRPAGSAVTVSRIGGGASINAIAEDAWLEVDVRGTSERALEALETEIRAVALAAAREEDARRTAGAPLTLTVERIGHRACGAVPVEAPLVAAAIEATRLVGRSPELAISSTDANAAIAAGIPAIAIGAGGRAGDVHTSHEWFDATAAGIGVARALTVIATAARLDELG